VDAVTKPGGKDDVYTKILGWVGCAPPMTTLEMEQAVQIPLDPPPYDDEGVGRVTDRVNFVRLCGPIIEDVDGMLQFVHFTAYQ
jgi:hypothetical protein